MDDDTGEKVYRWSIRALYVTAIALNLWLLWEQVKDTPEAGEMKARLERQRDKLTAPMRARKHLRAEGGKVIWEAMQIVEEAAQSAD